MFPLAFQQKCPKIKNCFHLILETQTKPNHFFSKKIWPLPIQENDNFKKANKLFTNQSHRKNPFFPPFKILQDPIFSSKFDPYLVFHHLFKGYFTEVKSIKNVFRGFEYLGEGAFSIVFEVKLIDNLRSYALKSIKFSKLNSVIKFKYLLVNKLCVRIL